MSGSAVPEIDQAATTEQTRATAGAPAGLTKDGDAVKLFVGQIPKDMGEDALRPFFAEYGPIFELTVIRDKTSGMHRGCAFLTYCTKEAAQAASLALHNKLKLPDAQNALQVSEFGEGSRGQSVSAGIYQQWETELRLLLNPKGCNPVFEVCCFVISLVVFSEVYR